MTFVDGFSLGFWGTIGLVSAQFAIVFCLAGLFLLLLCIAGFVGGFRRKYFKRLGDREVVAKTTGEE